jgi:hypothetical protein
MLCCAIAIYLFGRLYVGVVTLHGMLTGRPPEVRQNAASSWTRDGNPTSEALVSMAVATAPRFRMGVALAVVVLAAGVPILISKLSVRAEAAVSGSAVSAPSEFSASRASVQGPDAPAYLFPER